MIIILNITITTIQKHFVIKFKDYYFIFTEWWFEFIHNNVQHSFERKNEKLRFYHANFHFFERSLSRNVSENHLKDDMLKCHKMTVVPFRFCHQQKKKHYVNRWWRFTRNKSAIISGCGFDIREIIFQQKRTFPTIFSRKRLTRRWGEIMSCKCQTGRIWNISGASLWNIFSIR